MEDFFNAEISIYSRAGLFIYLFKEFLDFLGKKLSTSYLNPSPFPLLSVQWKYVAIEIFF